MVSCVYFVVRRVTISLFKLVSRWVGPFNYYIGQLYLKFCLCVEFFLNPPHRYFLLCIVSFCRESKRSVGIYQQVNGAITLEPPAPLPQKEISLDGQVRGVHRRRRKITR